VRFHDPTIHRGERSDGGPDRPVVHRALVPDVVEQITMDLRYLAISDALPQLAGLDLGTPGDLLVLVNLHIATLARSDEDATGAVVQAERALFSLS
jgi:hypothetical protein